MFTLGFISMVTLLLAQYRATMQTRNENKNADKAGGTT